MISQDGGRLDGEDTIAPAPGARIKGDETDFALRFHLHPAVKASRLSDARGVGRKQLPTTVIGLLVHAAEHTQRHVGQATTVLRVVRGGQAS